MADNPDIIYNLDIPDVDSPSNYQLGASVNTLCWERFYEFLDAVRRNCSGPENLGLFGITSDTHDTPLTNLVFEMTEYEEPIAVTIKCQRETIYFVALRNGRGEPVANDPENNSVWRQCDDCSVMPEGTQKAGFDANYGQAPDDIGVQDLGFNNLRNAVIELHKGINERKNFLVICTHVAEPVRFDCIVRYYMKNFRSNMFVSFKMRPDMIIVIKNWEKISLAIQEHLIKGEPFRLNVPGLEAVTKDNVREVIALLKNCHVKKPAGDNEQA